MLTSVYVEFGRGVGAEYAGSLKLILLTPGPVRLSLYYSNSQADRA